MQEDSCCLESLDAACEIYASCGYYSQGYGYGGWKHGRYDWPAQNRETRYEDLSGVQKVAVNCGINTEQKQAIFAKVKAITEGD